MLDGLILRLRSLLRRSAVEAEINDELRFHLERQTEKYVAAGIAPEEAERRARIELGSLERTREECREARGTGLVETIAQDLRYGLRALRRSPAFAVVAVSTLALGIGTSTAVLSVVSAVLWRPLPFPEYSRLLRIQESHMRPANLTGATFHDLESGNHVFSEVAALRILPRNLGDARSGIAPEEIAAASVSRNFFRLLRTPALLGRTLSADEFRAGAPGAVVLGYALWQRRYHGAPGVVGTTEIVHGRPFVVVGIMPRAFAYPEGIDAWVALRDEETIADNRRAHLFTTVGRLRAGVPLSRALSDLHAVAARVSQSDPTGDPGLELIAEPLEQNLNAGVRPALLLLLGAVGIVLLMACANVSNLQLSRAAVRQKSIAVRAALGASKGRLVRQLLTESALLGVLGGATGWLAGTWFVQLMFAAYPAALPHISVPSLDRGVLSIAVVAALGASLLSGILPALQLSRADLRGELLETGRCTGSTARRRIRSALITGQIALALILVVSAGLLLKTIVLLERVKPGYEPSGLLVVPLSLPGARYPALEQWQRFVDAILGGLRSAPGVKSVAATGGMPFRPTPGSDFEIAGRHFDPGDEPEAQIVTVTPDFFTTMGIRLLSGRTFTNRDVLGAPTALIINETMARQFWPGENPLGKRLTLKDWGEPLPGEIVGIVGDVKQEALDQPAQPAVYYSMAQFPQGTLTTYLLIRAEGSPEAISGTIRRKIWALDSALPVQVQAFERVIAESLERRRFTLALLATFAGLAMLLSVIGVYGLVANWVEQRAREFGVRMALGAQARDVVGMVLGEGLRLTARGLAIGALAALGFTRLLAGLLFGIQPADPLTFVTGAALLAGTSLAACWLPARRALRADPLAALRHE